MDDSATSSSVSLSTVAGNCPPQYLEPSMACENVRIFRRESPVSVLGPYDRAVVWVQGCSFECHGCIVPESWDPEAGLTVTVDELAEWIIAQPRIEGVTLSGGEPMLQAGGLSRLIDVVRSRWDMGVVCYTGYTFEYLQSHGSRDHHNLLARIDLLIDGVYRQSLHAALLWRGSSNQRLHLLTSRYAEFVAQKLQRDGDASAGMEITYDSDGGIGYAGVPVVQDFRGEFIRKMNERGIRLAIPGLPTAR